MKPQLSESLFSKHKHRQVSDVPLISWFNTSYLYSLHVSAFWQFVYTRFSTELYAWRSRYTTMVIADRLLNSPFFTLTQSEHSLSKLYPKTCLSVSSLIESVEGGVSAVTASLQQSSLLSLWYNALSASTYKVKFGTILSLHQVFNLPMIISSIHDSTKNYHSWQWEIGASL